MDRFDSRGAWHDGRHDRRRGSMSIDL